MPPPIEIVTHNQDILVALHSLLKWTNYVHGHQLHWVSSLHTLQGCTVTRCCSLMSGASGAGLTKQLHIVPMSRPIITFPQLTDCLLDAEMATHVHAVKLPDDLSAFGLWNNVLQMSLLGCPTDVYVPAIENTIPDDQLIP